MPVNQIVGSVSANPRSSELIYGGVAVVFVSYLGDVDGMNGDFGEDNTVCLRFHLPDTLFEQCEMAAAGAAVAEYTHC